MFMPQEYDRDIYEQQDVEDMQLEEELMYEFFDAGVCPDFIDRVRMVP